MNVPRVKERENSMALNLGTYLVLCWFCNFLRAMHVLSARIMYTRYLVVHCSTTDA